MRRKVATAVLVSTIACLLGRAAPGSAADLPALARTAWDGTSAESAAAIDLLRQAGPAGLEAMLALGRSGEALDRVCGVKDCAEIRLFWYTDLEAAQAAARAAGKPILSLRLMGRLDEELSCANSRFFRTVFYKNAEINELLRERYILHWRSVRPVPKVTIDFGDGNRLERTLTGNSIHYVLDSRGRLLEALPGLSGPAAFKSALAEAEKAAREAAHLSGAQLAGWAAARHAARLSILNETFRSERAAALPSSAAKPAALETASKMVSETPMLQALSGVTDDEIRSLAQQRRPRVRLDAESRAFLLRKHGVTDPGEAERLVDAFEATVALDEVINEYRTGPAILQKLINSEEEGFDLEAFNLQVYEEVFRTPVSDPWLGLAPEDVYAALPASTRTTAPHPER